MQLQKTKGSEGSVPRMTFQIKLNKMTIGWGKNSKTREIRQLLYSMGDLLVIGIIGQASTHILIKTQGLNTHTHTQLKIPS